MKKYLPFLLIIPCLLVAAPELDPLLLQKDDHLKIVVHNRVLANVNGNPITVIDVMKRMDILFLKQFPEYTQSVNARYQYYQANWKRTLNELIDKELILADSKEVKMEISPADVRQEMEDLFGPNIIVNLDKIGINIEEATKIVHGDIAIRRMMFLRVTSKALGKVTPTSTRQLYEEFALRNTKPPAYTYNVITIRDPILGKETAEKIYSALIEKKSLEESTKGLAGVTVSEAFTHTEKEIAPQNVEIIKSVKVGEVSSPQTQKSRADNSTVYRLFYVTGYNDGSPPSYHDVEAKLKEGLLSKYIDDEQTAYFKRLRKHYAMKDSDLKALVPADFNPFSLN